MRNNDITENIKVIFLDIDGVLNSSAYDRERKENDGNIDETRLPLIKRVVDETQAKIVLSSSWRTHWNRNLSLCDSVGKDMTALFAVYQLEIYDKTPVLSSNDRAEEIRMWLDKNKTVTHFVILDDNRFGWGELLEYLVSTSYRIGRGLEEKHLLEAIRLLNCENES
ncbi:MAG: hypothetical protein E7603_03265 [Ruminococcaceae bacterium]|nr:hypothetical protein [Oscillospiraceae bacterium]